MLRSSLALFLVGSMCAPACALSLAETIDLTTSAKGSAERSRTVSGGKFTPKGWEVTSKSDKIIIDLARPFGTTEAGAIEYEVTNFDPFGMQQLTKELTKHVTFSGYGPSHGMQDKIRSGEFMYQLRTHPNYIWSDGRNNARMLTFKWAPQSSSDLIGEQHWLGYPMAWDRTLIYKFRVEWNATQFIVLLPTGKSYTYRRQSVNKGLQYLFLARDNTSYYPATVGFTYSKVRIYRGNGSTVTSNTFALIKQQSSPPLLTADCAGRLVHDRWIDRRSGRGRFSRVPRLALRPF